METPSRVREPEAYIPPAIDAEHARYWPPSTRTVAIEWARRAGLREEGLTLDDATLERVADAVTDAAHPPAPFTVEVRDDVLPGSLWTAARDYLIRHPEVDGEVDFGFREGRRILVVGIVGDPQPHRAALEAIGGTRVVIEPRPPRQTRSEAELNAIADRIVADEPELATAGLYRDWMARAPELGVVEVHVAGGPDERAAAEFFAARYGDAVAVRWLGPSRFRELPHPFGSWTSDGRSIRVFFAVDPNGYQPGQACVTQETDELIVIALSALEPVGLITRMGGFRAHRVEFELREPVGGRAVIDASVGVARPSLAELRSRPGRRRPNPAGSDHFATGSLLQPTGISIDELELSVEACTVLKASGVEFIDDLGDLTLFSAEELAALPKMDQKVLDEIIDALPQWGNP